MLENEPQVKKKLPVKPIIAGAISGAITRLLCQPLDVIKIRFQLQVEPIHAKSLSSKYTSMPQAVVLMVKEEGIPVLWKGHIPAQALSVVYGMVQFGCYDELIKSCKPLKAFITPTVIDFSCGTIAGASAIVASSPLDVIRTRLVAQDKMRGYRNMAQAFTEITKLEGPRGLFRGCWTSIIQIGPQTGAQFMFHKLFKRFYGRLSNTEEKDYPFMVTFTAGALAGLGSKVLIYPLDLAKKRLQIQEFHMHRQTFGEHFVAPTLWRCLKMIVTKEGFIGLFKGLTPSVIKAMITTALHFSIYDEILKIL